MKNSFLRLLPLLILSWPARVFACAVCMGAPGSAVVDATNGFIFAMLGFLGAMLSGILAFAIYLMRHAKAPLPPHEELAQFVFNQDLEEGRQHA